MADHNPNNIQEIRDLADPNWRDPNDRRCIAACLVNVVYLLEKGNEKKKNEWCGLLKFNVKEVIKEDGIFGAVFQWVGKSKRSGGAEEPPLEVVAFRGTILKGNNLVKDMRHNWKAAMACHGSISRVDIGLQYLQRSIERHGPHNIWIAGHSLGAAIATAAARKVEREKRDKMEAYLFNPPFLSPRFSEVKFFEMIGRTLATGCDGPPSLRLPLLEGVYNKIEGASKWMKVRLGLEDDTILRGLYGDFIGVSGWIPSIYVNKYDLICCSYISYFEVMRGIYEQKSQPLHERMKYLFCYEVAKKRTPWHLLPSAKLFVKNSECKPHDLSQWWSRSLKLEGKEYVPPAEAQRHYKQCSPFS